MTLIIENDRIKLTRGDVIVQTGGDSDFEAALDAAVATINTALASKQDASTAATDAELASAVTTLNASLATKQDAAPAATDSELAAAVTTLTSAIALKQDAASAATDAELASAVATLNTALTAKQDAATAATDAELASAVSTLNAAIALKQDASTAATDAELASAVATINTALSGKVSTSLLGAANGVATLGSDSKVLTAQLPASGVINGRDFREWGSAVKNVDCSAVLQAAIDDCYARNDSTPIVIPPLSGLDPANNLTGDAWLANVTIKPNVWISGRGWRSVLRSNPGTSAPVIGSVKGASRSATDPSRNRITDLAIFGGNTQGATGRGIELLSGNSDAQWGYGSLPQQAGDQWNDTAPILSGLFVTDCAAEAVVIGRNQRGALFERSFIFHNVGLGALIRCTDGQFRDLQIGANGDGAMVKGLCNQFNGCKFWYSYGAFTDALGMTHTGEGMGLILRNDGTDDGSVTQLTGCETQDNFQGGVLLDGVSSVVANGHMAGGDGPAAIIARGPNTRFNTFRLSSVWADRVRADSVVTLDGAAGTAGAGTGTPTDNVFEFSDAESGTWLSRSGAFAPIALVNSGNVQSNTFRWHGSAGGTPTFQTPSAGGTYTPNCRYELHRIGMPAGNITIANPTNILPGATLAFSIAQDATGSRTVTWGSQYTASAGIPALTTTANSRTTYTFRNISSGIAAPLFVLMSKL